MEVQGFTIPKFYLIELSWIVVCYLLVRIWGTIWNFDQSTIEIDWADGLDFEILITSYFKFHFFESQLEEKFIALRSLNYILLDNHQIDDLLRCNYCVTFSCWIVASRLLVWSWNTRSAHKFDQFITEIDRLIFFFYIAFGFKIFQPFALWKIHDLPYFRTRLGKKFMK